VRIFLDEFLTCGGVAGQSIDSLPRSWLAEGLAMRRALEADIARLPDTTLVVMNDARLPRSEARGEEVIEVRTAAQREQGFAQCAARADWTLLIAPEMDGALELLARRVLEVGGKLLGPGPEIIALASDKQRLVAHLAAYGVRVPRGVELARDEQLPLDATYPAVLKPIDGAGSFGVELIRSIGQLDQRMTTTCQRWRLEAHCPGQAASVGVICGPAGRFALPACAQLLSHDGRFRYLGGRCPLPTSLQTRAHSLAREGVRTLGEVTGYVGVDLVLGDASDGSEDFVIEINPRITTSYVGLRAVCRDNLVSAMLDAVEGRAPTTSFASEAVHFTPDGAVRACEAPSPTPSQWKAKA